MKLVILILLSYLPLLSFAFPGGAGRCVVGEPAPLNRHPTPSFGADKSLQFGGYNITIDGTRITDADTTATVTADEPFEITLSASDSAINFKGFLIVVDVTDTSALEIDSSDGKQATTTGCSALPAVTHRDDDPKTFVTATATISEVTTTTLELNIVQEEAAWYYTQVQLTVVAGEPSAMPSPAPSPLESASPSAMPSVSRMPSAMPTEGPTHADSGDGECRRSILGFCKDE